MGFPADAPQAGNRFRPARDGYFALRGKIALWLPQTHLDPTCRASCSGESSSRTRRSWLSGGVPACLPAPLRTHRRRRINQLTPSWTGQWGRGDWERQRWGKMLLIHFWWCSRRGVPITLRGGVCVSVWHEWIMGRSWRSLITVSRQTASNCDSGGSDRAVGRSGVVVKLDRRGHRSEGVGC